MNRLIENEKAYGTLAIWSDGGRLPHAVLIEGEKGSGRGSFALELCRIILCEGEKRPCGQCRHCVKVEKGVHPDIAVYTGGEGARSFHIDQVRELRAEASIRPNEAEARVFLLRDVQNMSVQAQNALLKTIEEPAKGAHFILTCENRAQMLPTILSRVAVVTLETPSVERCAEHLPERLPGRAPGEYLSAAVEAGGNVGRALALLEGGEGGGAYARAKGTLRQLLEGEEPEALASLLPFERDREGLARYLGLMRAAAVGMFVPAPDPSLGITSLQWNRIIVIMDETASSLERNANLLLLTTALCARIRRVIAE